MAQQLISHYVRDMSFIIGAKKEYTNYLVVFLENFEFNSTSDNYIGVRVWHIGLGAKKLAMVGRNPMAMGIKWGLVQVTKDSFWSLSMYLGCRCNFVG